MYYSNSMYVDFYLLMSVKHTLDSRELETQAEYKLAEDVDSAFDSFVNHFSRAIEDYILVAGLGEARHLASHTEYTLDFITRDHVNKSRDGVYCDAHRFDKSALLSALIEAFSLNWKSSTYGGKKWLDCIQLVKDYREGKFDSVTFLDRAADLEHNGGNIFNKGVPRFECACYYDFKKLLDVKRDAINFADEFIALREDYLAYDEYHKKPVKLLNSTAKILNRYAKIVLKYSDIEYQDFNGVVSLYNVEAAEDFGDELIHVVNKSTQRTPRVACSSDRERRAGYECYHCGHHFDEDEVESDGYNSYCHECFNRYFTFCHECNSAVPLEDSVYSELSGANYCQECYINTFTTCERCNNEVYINDTKTRYGVTICDTCADNHTFCSTCHTLTRDSQVYMTREDERILADYNSKFHYHSYNSHEAVDDIKYLCHQCFYELTNENLKHYNNHLQHSLFYDYGIYGGKKPLVSFTACTIHV